VIRLANELGMVTMPGAFTPTELETAYEAGADLVKVFPASDLGPGYFKSVRGPLGHIPLVAVGGVIAYHNFSVAQADYKTTFTSYSLLPAVKLSWYNRDHFSSYSKLALGASLIHEVDEEETTNSIAFNGQITLLGIDTGWKRFRIFGELGFGQQGLALFGLRYRW
jgi:hypothetical protein